MTRKSVLALAAMVALGSLSLATDVSAQHDGRGGGGVHFGGGGGHVGGGTPGGGRGISGGSGFSGGGMPGGNAFVNRGVGGNGFVNRGVTSQPFVNRGVTSQPFVNRGVTSRPLVGGAGPGATPFAGRRVSSDHQFAWVGQHRIHGRHLHGFIPGIGYAYYWYYDDCWVLTDDYGWINICGYDY